MYASSKPGDAVSASPRQFSTLTSHLFTPFAGTPGVAWPSMK